MENPEINPYICGQLIFLKDAKTIQWGKNSLFNKWGWDNWISTYERIKLDPLPQLYTKLTKNDLDLSVKKL